MAEAQLALVFTTKKKEHEERKKIIFLIFVFLEGFVAKKCFKKT
jgi:hypothetical protein